MVCPIYYCDCLDCFRAECEGKPSWMIPMIANAMYAARADTPKVPMVEGA